MECARSSPTDNDVTEVAAPNVRVHTPRPPCFVMHALRRPWALVAGHSHSCHEADHSEAEASSFGKGQREKLVWERCQSTKPSKKAWKGYRRCGL